MLCAKSVHYIDFHIHILNNKTILNKRMKLNIVCLTLFNKSIRLISAKFLNVNFSFVKSACILFAYKNKNKIDDDWQNICTISKAPNLNSNSCCITTRNQQITTTTTKNTRKLTLEMMIINEINTTTTKCTYTNIYNFCKFSFHQCVIINN